MSSTPDAQRGPNGRGPKRDGYRIAFSAIAAGALLTALWALALIALLRWLIVTIF